MEEKRGPYSLLNQRVKDLENRGAACIDKKDLAGFIDLSEMDRDKLEEQCANAMAANILWQNGYRSFVKGEGLFIHPAKFKDPRFIRQIVNNAVKERNKREAVIKGLMKIEKNCISTYADNSKEQYFDIDENGNMIIREELNIDEALQFLRMLSESVI